MPGDDADELVLTAARPRLYAEFGDRGAFLVGADEVRRALNQDAPPFLGDWFIWSISNAMLYSASAIPVRRSSTIELCIPVRNTIVWS